MLSLRKKVILILVLSNIAIGVCANEAPGIQYIRHKLNYDVKLAYYKWKAEILYGDLIAIRTLAQVRNNPDYKTMVSIGTRAVPFLYNRLKNDEDISVAACVPLVDILGLPQEWLKCETSILKEKVAGEVEKWMEENVRDKTDANSTEQ